jgi:hypothetical protein
MGDAGVKKESKNAQIKKLQLNRETLQKLELEKEDYLQVVGGTFSHNGIVCPTSPQC